MQPSSKANEQVQETSTATFCKKFALPLILVKRYERRKKKIIREAEPFTKETIWRRIDFAINIVSQER